MLLWNVEQTWLYDNNNIIKLSLSLSLYIRKTTDLSLSGTPPTSTMCTLERRGNLFYLTLSGSDPEHRLSPARIESILSALRQAASQSTRGSALITTSTGKFFSNGFDLAWAQSANSKEEAAQRLGRMVAVFKPVVAALLSLPMPTIAAINGHAAAAGFMLALSHDYILMRSDKGNHFIWFTITIIKKEKDSLTLMYGLFCDLAASIE